VDTYGRRVMARLWIVAAVSLLSPLFAGPGPAVAGLITSAAVTLCGQTLAESGSAATFVGPVNADCGNFTAAGSAKANAGFVTMGTEALFLVQSTGPSNVLKRGHPHASGSPCRHTRPSRLHLRYFGGEPCGAQQH
jgi:hypothetical protein